MQEMWVPSLGGEDPLEKEMATHSSIPAWKIPGTEEPGGIPSMGSQRVGHDSGLSVHMSRRFTLQNGRGFWRGKVGTKEF